MSQRSRSLLLFLIVLWQALLLLVPFHIAERAQAIANMMEVMVLPYCRAHDYPLDGGSMDALPASIHRKMT